MGIWKKVFNIVDKLFDSSLSTGLELSLLLEWLAYLLSFELLVFKTQFSAWFSVLNACEDQVETANVYLPGAIISISTGLVHNIDLLFYIQGWFSWNNHSCDWAPLQL